MTRAVAPFFYLRNDETVLRKEGAAPGYAVLLFLSMAGPVTILAAAALVALRFFPDVPIEPAWVATVWAALALVSAFAAWRRWATTEYVLTDQRIYSRHGRLVASVHFATHDKVTDGRYRQGPLERLVGVSGLTFATSGGDVHLPGIVDALAVKEAAERARDAFIQRLLQEARVEAPARHAPPTEARAPLPPAPPPVWSGRRPDYVKADDAPAWSARPATVSAVGEAKSLLGVFALLLAATLFRQGPFGQLAAVLPFVVLFALVAIGVRVLALRRTEYLATDRRVYARTGLFGTTVKQLTYDKITDITYRQDLLGRLLGYGTVSLATAGGAQGAIQLHGLAAPLAAKETIEALRARYLREAGA